jgi:hypothetical protein
VTRLSITVDDEQVVRATQHAITTLEELITIASVITDEEAMAEGGAVTPKLGAPWEITGVGPTERQIVAPEWWAHFLAHGTRPHGPNNAQFLVFEVSGEMVFASFVSGVKATHFDERAVERAKSKVEQAIVRALG